MVIVVRRGGVRALADAAALGGSAAVACLRGVGAEPAHAGTVAAWRPRPGKVCLRARSQREWDQVLALPHALAGDADGAGVAALPPMRRDDRPALLDRLQAMRTALEPPPARAAAADERAAVTYVLNPEAVMSTGKAVAQVAHAAVMAADGGGAPAWVAAGCPGRVLAPDAAGFDAARRDDGALARVLDGGLTELAPGTLTVIALAPGPASGLPPALRA